MKKKFDIYETVTEKFISGLKMGKIPWKKPYTGFEPKNIFSNTEYHGINILLLGMLPYEYPFYLTYKQAQRLGGTVKKGEHGSMILYWNMLKKEKEDSNGNKKDVTIPFLRYYKVFNISQCEGIEFDIPDNTEKKELEPIEIAEKIVNNCPVNVQYGSQIPCYIPTIDAIHLPQKEQFNSNHEFYSTFHHEYVHSTGHKYRLDRKGITAASGKNLVQYSKEELIAEIGSSFLNHFCGFGDIEQQNSQAYVNGWITYLQNNPKDIVSAAGKAQKASDYILNNA